MNREIDVIFGFIVGAVIVAMLFMYISTYNGALLKRGLAEYNIKTGDLELKECENELDRD